MNSPNLKWNKLWQIINSNTSYLFAANIITNIIDIEDQLRLEYPKRNRGRPAAHQLILQN